MLDASEIARARQVDLLRLIEPDTTLVRIANTRGGEYAGPCPFCGGVDRVHVAPRLGKWYCRHCAPRGGDAIDDVRRMLAQTDALPYSHAAAQKLAQEAIACLDHFPDSPYKQALATLARMAADRAA